MSKRYKQFFFQAQRQCEASNLFLLSEQARYCRWSAPENRWTIYSGKTGKAVGIYWPTRRKLAIGDDIHPDFDWQHAFRAICKAIRRAKGKPEKQPAAPEGGYSPSKVRMTGQGEEKPMGTSLPSTAPEEALAHALG